MIIMCRHRIAQLSRARIDEAEEKAEAEGIEKLGEVAVVEGEKRRGKEDGGLVPVAAHAADYEPAEEQLLEDGPEDDGEYHRHQRGRGIYGGLDGIYGLAAQSAEEHVEQVAHDTEGVHYAEAHDKGDHELAERHGVLLTLPRGHLFYHGQTDREPEYVYRDHGKRPDIPRLLRYLRRVRAQEQRGGYLDGGRHDEHGEKRKSNAGYLFLFFRRKQSVQSCLSLPRAHIARPHTI